MLNRKKQHPRRNRVTLALNDMGRLFIFLMIYAHWHLFCGLACNRCTKVCVGESDNNGSVLHYDFSDSCKESRDTITFGKMKMKYL